MEEKKFAVDIFQKEEKELIEESSIEYLKKIISYSVSNSVQTLIQKIKNNEIDLKPEFQRDFVWDIKRSSQFIDSLLIGLPTPSIFLGKKKSDESFMVIDGQQRLKSIFYYISGKFVFNAEESTFSLRGIKDDRDWQNRTFAELGETLQRRLNNAVLNTTIIEDIDSRPQVVHDLFSRLNTGGVPLTDQEIRNCVYEGVFNKQINTLNNYQNWRILLDNTKPDTRLRDAELILRFFALLYNLDNYRPSMRNFLSSFQEQNANNTEFIEFNEELFKFLVDFIVENFGENAFKIKASFNKSVYDAIMVAIAQIKDNLNSIIDLKNNYKRLIIDEEFLKYVSSGTSGTKSVVGRIDLARNYLLGVK